MAPALPALAPPDLEAALQALHEASFGWARSCCSGDPDDAADVLQTSYCKVLSGSATFAGRSSFRTWLFGIIRFTAMEHRRRGARELPFASIEEPESPALAADDRVIEAETVAALRAALGQLPDRQREVMHLVFHQELSVADAAGVMGVSIGTARVHYDRGKKRLRVLLAGGDPGPHLHSIHDER
jgi:RNA polymerase sigma-70 factor (ECF subfamily)